MAQMLQSKRATRGLRMSALVDEAAEQDETFWNNEVWGEDGSDDSFSEEEVKPDVFDSDFNDTEDDGDEGSSDDEPKAKEREKPEKANKYKEPEKKQQKKGPPPAKRKSVEISSSEPQHKKRNQQLELKHNDLSFDRVIRTSTKAKTLDSGRARERADAQKTKQKQRPQIKHQFTQRALLEDALLTERTNQTWLETQKLAETERAASESRIKPHSDGSWIRHLSRKGTYNTITFPDVDHLPKCLQPVDLPVLPDKICAVTGQPARYKDPVTQLPYANLEAFQELRRRSQRG